VRKNNKQASMFCSCVLCVKLCKEKRQVKCCCDLKVFRSFNQTNEASNATYTSCCYCYKYSCFYDGLLFERIYLFSQTYSRSILALTYYDLLFELLLLDLFIMLILWLFFYSDNRWLCHLYGQCNRWEKIKLRAYILLWMHRQILSC
jgi:hypothetical protein